MENMPVVNLGHARKAFGSNEVLKDISLTVNQGDVLSIIGPSGGGKSTLLRCMTLLETLDAGSLAYGDVKVAEADSTGKAVYGGKDVLAQAKERYGLVFQNFNLFPHFTVLQNVTDALISVQKRPKEEALARGRELLAKMGLADKEDMVPCELSGGQQQRVAIARSLVNEPEILLLDEPLGALDLKLRKEMQLELKRLQREMNITFIYVTHDQEEALTMSDTVVVMNGGKVQQIGTPEDIYNEPKNAFVADFIGDSNIVDGVMHRDFLVSFSGVQFPCVDRGFAREQSVQVVVRPEDIEVVSPVEGQLVGVVNDVIFKGVHFEMHVECEGREWLIHSTRACTPGETIGMRIGPNEIHIMARSEG